MGYHNKLHNKLYYYFALCILTVSPVVAETNNNANPVAAATSNNTNQSVQFNIMVDRLDNILVLVSAVTDLR